MLNNYYEIYINKCTQLASTLIIKSQDTVDGLNKFVHDQATQYNISDVDLTRPETFKYYLNISGRYHILDTMMLIVSMDTLNIIEFTKENLLLNPATARAYQYGSRHYQILLTEYPDQELLIKGILYPVDMDKAIAAKDGTILGYPADLVEANEYSLISNLQKWIYGYKLRWVNIQYGVSDVLYPATSLGLMYLNLLPAILTSRLSACKTNEAHSFHVRQYLASHNLLNDYIDNMTVSQALFFYRNITYIERNSGKKAVFDWLIYNIMTVRDLPIAEYVMHHELSDTTNNIYPNIIFYRNSLNRKYDLSNQSKLNLDSVLNIENELAINNKKHNDTYLPKIREVMENSTRSIVATKILESSVVDYSNSGPFNLLEILLNEWIDLASSGKYIAYINVLNPKTNNIITLSVKDAYTLALYVFYNSIGINVVTIPPALAVRAQRIVSNTTSTSTIVTVDEIMSVVDSKRVDRSIAVKALSLQPEIDTIISIEAFYNTCYKIYTAAQMQRHLVASQEPSIQRGMVSSMVSRIYCDSIHTLEPPDMLYGTWLNMRNIDLEGLGTSELATFFTTIVSAVTGMADFANSSIGSIQKAMMAIMGQLSSYGIQFISTINSGSGIKTDWTLVRADNILSKYSTNVGILGLGSSVVKDISKSNLLYRHSTNISNITPNSSICASINIKNIFSKLKDPVINTPVTRIKMHTEIISTNVIAINKGVVINPKLDIYGFNENTKVNPNDTVEEYTYANGTIVDNVTNTNLNL